MVVVVVTVGFDSHFFNIPISSNPFWQLILKVDSIIQKNIIPTETINVKAEGPNEAR